ncbi:MAG: protein-disulfide reductase DsbD N-terminal domain-containing protein [Gemmataceae bacterium]
MRRTILIALVALVCGADAPSTGKKSADVVKLKATSTKPDANGKQTITVVLTIDKSWHIYANPVGSDDLSSVQTVVNLTSTGKLEDVSIDYPHGKLIKDPIVGNYAVYENEVTIKATVKRPAGSKEDLEVTAKIQACSDKSCLPTSTLKSKVEAK